MLETEMKNWMPISFCVLSGDHFTVWTTDYRKRRLPVFSTEICWVVGENWRKKISMSFWEQVYLPVFGAGIWYFIEASCRSFSKTYHSSTFIKSVDICERFVNAVSSMKDCTIVNFVFNITFYLYLWSDFCAVWLAKIQNAKLFAYFGLCKLLSDGL